MFKIMLAVMRMVLGEMIAQAAAAVQKMLVVTQMTPLLVAQAEME
jgi:hypothetical protein